MGFRTLFCASLCFKNKRGGSFLLFPLVFSKILVVERIYFITFAKKLKRKEYAEEELLFGIGSRFERQ